MSRPENPFDVAAHGIARMGTLNSKHCSDARIVEMHVALALGLVSCKQGLTAAFTAAAALVLSYSPHCTRYLRHIRHDGFRAAQKDNIDGGHLSGEPIHQPFDAGQMPLSALRGRHALGIFFRLDNL